MNARLELREMHPPSAFEGDFDRFRQLLWLVSAAEFRTQYADTALGFLWTIVRPLFFFGVIFLVLRNILGVGLDVKGYGESLVISLILFTFFADTTTRAVRSIPAKEAMVRKMRFPRIIIPLSVCLTSTFTLLLNLIAVFPLLLAFGLEPYASWLLFIPILLTLVVLTLSVSMILSVLYVRVRDTAQAWSLVSRVLFYASPVLYPLELISISAFVKIISVSPLTLLFAESRVFLVDPKAPGPVDEAGIWLGLVAPVSMILVLAVVAVRLFVRDAPRMAEEL